MAEGPDELDFDQAASRISNVLKCSIGEAREKLKMMVVRDRVWIIVVHGHASEEIRYSEFVSPTTWPNSRSTYKDLLPKLDEPWLSLPAAEGEEIISFQPILSRYLVRWGEVKVELQGLQVTSPELKTKNKGGAPPKYDWPMFRLALAEYLRDNGHPASTAAAPAELVNWSRDWFGVNAIELPQDLQLKEHVKDVLNIYLTALGIDAQRSKT